MTHVFKVSGTRPQGRGGTTGSQGTVSTLDGVTEKVVVVVTPVSARSVADRVKFEAEDDDVLEFELANDLVIWVRADEVADELGGATRGDAEVSIPASWWRAGTTQRGLGSWAIKSIKVLSIIPESTKGVAEYIDSRQVPKQGLFRLVDQGADVALRMEEVAPANDVSAEEKPALLFLHGTASNTKGSFGGLWRGTAGPWKALRKKYEDRIFAFEHHTLGRGPIENAIKLLARLAPGSRLHVVSHSRGGLIAELLCRHSMRDRTAARSDGPQKAVAPADRVDAADAPRPKIDEDYGNDPSLKRLDELDALLEQKRIRIEKIVRVGCPTGGTTLLSRRLDRFLNMMAMSAKLITGGTGDIAIEVIRRFTLEVLKTRTDPKTLPGLEAMVPESPLVRILNRQDRVVVDSELYIVAGDIQPGNLLFRLGVALTDWFYGQDHDLVVNTCSMRGGMPRKKPALEFHTAGEHVSHFSYFRNSDSARAVVNALHHSEGELHDFQPMRPAEPVRSRGQRADKDERPTVFLLPGIMGAKLAEETGEAVWVDVNQLSERGFGALAAKRPLRPTGVVENLYGGLIQLLERSHHVVPFAYDWRKSFTEAADNLARQVETMAKESTKPVRFVAHSTGGLVLLSLMARHPNVWKHVAGREGARALLLGTPIRGSYAVARTLLGQDSAAARLALLKDSPSREQILLQMRRFPGWIEALPSRDDDPACDLLSPEFWKRIDGDGPSNEDLANARRFQDAISGVDLGSKLFCHIAGHSELTPDAMRLTASAADEGCPVEFFATDKGDGVVSWARGPSIEMKTWYMPVRHGDLANHAPSFKALLELLQEGNTEKLPQKPPAPLVPWRGERAMPHEVPQAFPDAPVLARLVMGGGSVDCDFKSKAAARPLDVRILHGHVAFAETPVMLGHYQDDPIVGLENEIDELVGGRLRRRRELGAYADEVGSAEVFAGTEKGSFPGAIVVGLGLPGTLTAGTLKLAAKAGVIRYAIDRRNLDFARRDGYIEHGLRISCVLMGASDGGIEMATTIEGILDGIREANSSLSKLEERWRVSEVEFIEIYQDRAIQAARVLREMCGRDTNNPPWLRFSNFLTAGKGGRVRATLEGTISELRHLHITSADGEGRFNYLTVTDSARMNVLSVEGQMELVDAFVQSAISEHGHVDASKTLFELLIPNELKTMAGDYKKLALILDSQTARFPWEMMCDRMAKDQRPISISSAVIRQLRREHPRRSSPVATGDRALVIGNVRLPDDMAALPGARAEAEDVVKALSASGFKCESSVEDVADQIVNKLLGGDYRVLHLSGHGENQFDARGNQIGGLILSAPLSGPGGNGSNPRRLYLNPALIRQMRKLPELAFLNCCHVGKAIPLDERINELAATLAIAMIDMGVKAVVAAGWAIDDAAARLFANVFYSEMLNGEKFGTAVTAARRKVYYEHGKNTNTWGAYQCYGDFDYRLRSTGEAGVAKMGRKDAFVSPSEALIEMENVQAAQRVRDHKNSIQDADNDPIEDEIRKCNEIEDVLARIPDAWKSEPAGQEQVQSGEFVASIAKLKDLVYSIDDAIKTYKMALHSPDGSASLSSLLDLALVQLRSFRQSGDKTHALEALEHLQQLVDAAGGTPERERALRDAKEQAELPQSLERVLMTLNAYRKNKDVKHVEEALEHLQRLLEEVRDPGAGERTE